MKRLHFWIGVAGVLTFLGTGQYMLRWLNLPAVDALPRMLYRSAHIYLLMGSLLNLLLGLYLPQPRAGWPRWVSRAGSVLILVAPFVFLAAFVSEAQRTDLHRPLAGPAVFACAIGVVLHAIARAGVARATPDGVPYEST